MELQKQNKQNSHHVDNVKVLTVLSNAFFVESVTLSFLLKQDFLVINSYVKAPIATGKLSTVMIIFIYKQSFIYIFSYFPISQSHRPT